MVSLQVRIAHCIVLTLFFGTLFLAVGSLFGFDSALCSGVVGLATSLGYGLGTEAGRPSSHYRVEYQVPPTHFWSSYDEAGARGSLERCRGFIAGRRGLDGPAEIHLRRRIVDGRTGEVVE